jgi:hypothetical protein
MALKTDRRTQLRKRPLSLVYVELPPSNGGMMRDLSEHGFSLRAMLPLRQSEKVPFSFALDAAARIDGEAIVVRVDDGGHVAALEFAGLPSHSRDQIRRWQDKFDEQIFAEAEPAQPTASKHVSLTELRTQIRAPKPPSPAPPAKRRSLPPAKETKPPTPDPPVMSLPTSVYTPVPSPVDDAPEPPLRIAMPPTSEPSSASVSPVAEVTPLPAPKVEAPPTSQPLPPPVVESPQPPPLQTAMALPKPASPPPDEIPQPSPPALQSAFEQRETRPLPPLLKLSSVRPTPPAEIPAEPVVPVPVPKPAAEPPAKVQVPLRKLEAPAATEKRIPNPVPAPPVAPRRVLPPALEPLSSLEGDTDSDTPDWMDGFTIGRAIRIMLFLTLAAGSYVYHRELGQALIWLGHQIVGEETPETSKPVQPETPAAARPIPKPSPPARSIPPPPLTIQPSTASNEPKGTNLPPASDKTPSPQLLKDAKPGSLVPLTQVTRPTAPASTADNSVEAGQEEYLQALQILRTPSRASEVPAAIQLLWVAVEKGNTGAEIDLAELFRKGRGVAKNCDQTRILLSAAARKGSAEARKRLEAFQREGCRN